MSHKIPVGHCGCCGNGPIPETDLWCKPCAEHVSKDSTLSLWDRAYETVHGTRCPLSLWSCAQCGHDTMMYLPIRGGHVCAKCFEMVPRFVDVELDEIPLPTDEECAALQAEFDKLSDDPKQRCTDLYIRGDYKSPAEAAKAIGYEWTDTDQTQFERDTYIDPKRLDKLYKMMAAIREAKKVN